MCTFLADKRYSDILKHFELMHRMGIERDKRHASLFIEVFIVVMIYDITIVVMIFDITIVTRTLTGFNC